jgi:hypothetical protein
MEIIYLSMFMENARENMTNLDFTVLRHILFLIDVVEGLGEKEFCLFYREQCIKYYS